MKIVEVTHEHIKFDNGSMITFDHVQDCCEYNYADFEQIEEQALETEFSEELFFSKQLKEVVSDLEVKGPRCSLYLVTLSKMDIIHLMLIFTIMESKF